MKKPTPNIYSELNVPITQKAYVICRDCLKLYILTQVALLQRLCWQYSALFDIIELICDR